MLCHGNKRNLPFNWSTYTWTNLETESFRSAKQKRLRDAAKIQIQKGGFQKCFAVHLLNITLKNKKKESFCFAKKLIKITTVVALNFCLFILLILHFLRRDLAEIILSSEGGTTWIPQSEVALTGSPESKQSCNTLNTTMCDTFPVDVHLTLIHSLANSKSYKKFS
jgi:hypothetical protein